MKVTNSVENVVTKFPLILALNKSGLPMRWITYEDSAFYYAKEKVLWSLGKHAITLRGGVNAHSGEQSTLDMDTIIALDSDSNPMKYRTRPALHNRSLFQRDKHVCAYCSESFSSKILTRDHVIPRAQGGPNTWVNVVTSCKNCNHTKGNRTPEQANMPLIYVPYEPTFNEYLILRNRKILADQMDFLMKGVSRESRLRLN